jgi:DNA polymerase elongation subunit (family B)
MVTKIRIIFREMHRNPVLTDIPFRKRVSASYLNDRLHVQFQVLAYDQIDKKPDSIPNYKFENITVNGDLYRNAPEAVDDRRDKSLTDFWLQLYGRTPEGYSICVHVDYWPCLLVCLPDKWRRPEAASLMSLFFNSRKIGNGILAWEMQHFHRLAGFFPDLKSQEPRLAKFPFLQIWCKSKAYVAYVRNFFKYSKHSLCGVHQHQFEVIEEDIPPVLQFLQSCSGEPSGVLEVKREALHLIRGGGRLTHCDLEYECTVRQAHGHNPFRRVSEDAMFPVILFSFDIECVPEHKNRFPDASNPKDSIICICSIARNMKTGETIRASHSLGDHDCIEGELLQFRFHDEAKMCEEWRDFVIYIDPDIITGYNSHRFDWPYLNTRMELFNGQSRFFFLSRMICNRCVMQENEFSSKAHGSSMTKQFNIPGRVDMDLYTYAKRNFKLKSYKLNNVAHHFLKKNKIDLSIADMNANYRSGDSGRLAMNVQYCVKDAELPIELWENQYILASIVEMSRVTCVFVQDLFSRGQMFKVVSQLYMKGRRLGFALTAFPGNPDITSYKGATVLDIKDGYYEVVAVLDFASLYPSIMKAKNLCYTSLVTDEVQYGHLEKLGYEYYECTTNVGTNRFQQSIKGLLPIIIDELLNSRTHAKKLMNAAKQAGDFVLATIYNARQLALKISCNSIYGFTGAAQSKYWCPSIASTVTYYGRELIDSTKKIIEQTYSKEGAEVIYGDSVTGDTPILVRWCSGDVDLVEIQDIAQRYSRERKDFAFPLGVQVWSDGGWTDVVRVIRHWTAKQVIRVLTPTGAVDCTEDHSLLTPHGRRVKPSQVRVGDHLMHHALPLFTEEDCIVTAQDAFVFGVFMRKGSCRIRSSTKADWSLQDVSFDVLKMCQETLNCNSFGLWFQIRNARALIPMGAGTLQFGLYCRKSCYYKQAKVVPLVVLKASAVIRKAFLCGYLAATGQVLDEHEKSLEASHKMTSNSLFLLCKGLGYECCIAEKLGIYQITIGKNALLHRASTAIQKMYNLPLQCDYVYDLETKSHHFSAGVGELVLHNTDSVMVVFNHVASNQEGFERVFDLGHEAAKLVSHSFEDAIVLEMEKVYRPALMQVKKHYAAMSFEHKGDKGKIDAKGIALVRRDFCDYHQNAYREILDALLSDRDMEKGLRVLAEHLQLLVSLKVPLQQLVLSRQLAKEYKNANICQKIVADKIESRMPGSGPKSGDRVDFVVVVIPLHNDKAPLYKKVEDIGYVEAHQLRPDLKYYLKAFLPCMTSLFKPFKISQRLSRTFAPFLGQASRINNGNTSISSFFPAKHQLTIQGEPSKRTKTSMFEAQKTSAARALKSSVFSSSSQKQTTLPNAFRKQSMFKSKQLD